MMIGIPAIDALRQDEWSFKARELVWRAEQALEALQFRWAALRYGLGADTDALHVRPNADSHPPPPPRGRRSATRPIFPVATAPATRSSRPASTIRGIGWRSPSTS